MHYGKPTEGAWAAMKASPGTLAVRDVDQLAAIVKNRLKRIQYRARPTALKFPELCPISGGSTL